MKNIKSLKRIISFLVCLLMLFNIAVIGTAQKAMGVSMFWTDDFENGEWNSISTDTSVFNITDFEPGAENIKYFKIENSGDKALSYKFEFEGEVSKLADVIDVYCLQDVTGNVTVSQMTKIGTLSQVLSGTSVSDGKMLPEGLTGDGFYTKERYVAVALKMQDGLGNEYQNLSLGDGFTIKLTATECEYTYPPYDTFDVVFENTDEYLYRVGNANTVTLSSLFKAVDGAKIGTVEVTVDLLDSDTNVSYVYTANPDNWADGTIQFSGTGPVKVTISDTQTYGNANSVSLNLEVVNATNVTKYGELKNQNSVLLNDITMPDKGAFDLSNATLYGNGFTFDVTKGAYETSGYISGNYLVSLTNAHLDNIKIVGKVYTQYGATRHDPYNRATVFSAGNNTITNSYISNCATPVRVNDGNLEIINSTLKGGNFANLDIRGGNVVLDNVTTINQVADNDAAEDGTVVVGFGVVVYYENVLNTTMIEVKNGLTQYNHLSKTEAENYITDDTAKKLVEAMYSSDYSAVQYNDGTDTWVHTGILSMSENVGNDNISDVEGYSDANPKFLGKQGYIHTRVPDSTSIAETAPEWSATAQGAIAPSYSFDFTNKNYVAKTDGSNDYCYEENGTVLISMDQGDTVNWDTSILTATKVGKPLSYTVSMDGTDYTGKTIPFNTAGNYTVTYTYTDPNNYDVDENGNVTTYSKAYTKKVDITVAVIAPETKTAEFTFGSSNQATEKITVGNNTYISATGVSHDNSKWSYITVNGTKIYYPIVEATIVEKKLAYFNVFKDVVTITDYADGGTGDAITYNSSTTSMPSGLTVVKGLYAPFANISSNWSTLNDTALNSIGASKVFKYAGSADASSTPTTYKNALAFVSPELTKERPEAITIAQYSYTDAANNTYYYYVGYHMAEKGDGCFAEGTLITLADGSTKKIEELTFDDELLVWDFFNGEYTTATPSLLIDDGENDYEIITLNFDDGSDLRIIYEHGLFDVEENDYVLINKGNANEYIGHTFIKNNGTENVEVKLESVEITNEYIGCYTLLTAQHNNCIANGLLTVTPPPIDRFYDYFEIGEGMKYDEALMQADIEEYGLYTYDDFKAYISYEEFIAFNGPYLKVLVGKGYITFNDILEQIQAFGVGSEYTPEEETEEPDPVDIPEEDPIVPLNEEEIITSVTVISAKNTVSTAGYKVTFIQNENVLTLTASGTATSGYAIITLDGDTYYTGNIAVGKSIEITVKNLDVAKDKNIKVTSSWGTCDPTITDNIIDLGEFKVLAGRSETGVSVTLSNTTKYDVTGDVYVAVYSAGRLVSVNKLNMTATAKNDTPKLFESSLSETDKVRVFMWETGTMKPMINLIEI